MSVPDRPEMRTLAVIRVLLIEDSPDDACLTKEMLSESGNVLFDLTHVERMGLALKKLSAQSFDVVLLDLSLPDANGLESISQLRTVSPDIPLVVLSGWADESIAIQALREGAQDYLVKGQASGHLLIRSVRYAIERKRSEDRLAYLANFDQLTGLANRSLFRERLARALDRSKRQEQPVYAIYVDLDGFKETNDTRGHAVGDRLLKAVGERLRSCLRTVDTVARIGGDEFSAVLEGVRRASDAVTIAIKVLEVLAQPFSLDDTEIFVTASIGLAAYPDDAGDMEALLRCADMAMYEAKAQGGNAVQLYAAGTGPQNAGRGALGNDLRRALAKGEFCLYYQPQIDLSTGRTIGVEALIRWRHPERGLLTPGSFIGAAEENGLIVQIGRWVMHVACAQYRVWLDQGLLPECAAINLSPRQFRDRDLIETVARALASNDLPPQHLEVELTENFLLENTHERINTLSELKALGIRVSLDDFGTGYSSLRYLKVLPLDRLKIDQSFVGGLTTASKDDAIVSTIIRLARSLGLDVLAEGVETEAQRSFLGDHGCEAIQGYLISPPLNVDAMTEWLSDERLSCMAAA
jgi:diguanylate cyclase